MAEKKFWNLQGATAGNLGELINQGPSAILVTSSVVAGRCQGPKQGCANSSRQFGLAATPRLQNHGPFSWQRYFSSNNYYSVLNPTSSPYEAIPSLCNLVRIGNLSKYHPSLPRPHCTFASSGATKGGILQSFSGHSNLSSRPYRPEP